MCAGRYRQNVQRDSFDGARFVEDEGVVSIESK